MKLGYSLLLGEFVKAEEVEYQDCKNFQITCPECSEPVFKGVKRFSDKSIPTHYFAHYEKTKSLVEECELRVGSISSEDISVARTESRNQRLRFFLEVFSEAVHQMLKITSESLNKPEKLWWMLDKLKRSKPVSVDLFNLIFEAHKSGFARFSEEEMNEIFDTYINDFGEKYLERYSKKSFSLMTQKRIAIDFYRHLMSSQARDNFKLLFIAGYFMLLYRIIISIQTKQPYTEDFEPQLHKAVLNLPELNRKKGQESMSKMASTVIRYRSGLNPISLLGKIQTEITHEMFGVLLKIDYLNI